MTTYYLLLLIVSCVGLKNDKSNSGIGNVPGKDYNIGNPEKKLDGDLKSDIIENKKNEAKTGGLDNNGVYFNNFGKDISSKYIGSSLQKLHDIKSGFENNKEPSYEYYNYNKYDENEYKFKFDEGNPDLYEKIERPCEVYDTFCIRRFFAQLSKCKIIGGPVPAVSVIYPELEKQYAPEQWSKRFASPEEVLPNHIKVVTAASEEAVATIPHQLGLQYGSSLKTKLDIFGTDLPNDAPILVYIHGGYWQLLGREISRYPAHPLYRCGVKTIVIGYDLCPNVTLPQIVEETYDAARYVFEYAENMGSRGVYFAGHSAGGHLVAKILSNAFLENTPGSHRLRGAFLISGVFDLRELVYTSLNDAIQLPIELAVPLSPLFDTYSHLQGSGIRIYIIVGENDSPRFKKISRELYEVLRNTWQLENLYFKILGAVDHFSIVEWLAHDNNYLKSWLVQSRD